MEHSIKIQALAKTFPSGGLKQLSFELGLGVTAIIGPNGAGKSTLLRCLSTYFEPDGGSVRYGALDIHRFKAEYCYCLGYLPEKFCVPGHLTCTGFLQYIAALKLIPHSLISDRIAHILALLNLQHYSNTRVSRLSPGVLRRLGLAQAILNDPYVLLLDEPTSGLDPVERRTVLNLLGDLAADRIIVLATHLLSDVQAIAENTIVLQAGEVVAHGRTTALIRQVTSANPTLQDAYSLILRSGDGV